MDTHNPLSTYTGNLNPGVNSSVDSSLEPGAQFAVDPKAALDGHTHSTGIGATATNSQTESHSPVMRASPSHQNQNSRGHIYASVVVLSIGILALILAITFYFVNGRSWRRRSNVDTEDGSSVTNSSVDLELNNHSKAKCLAESTATTIEAEKPLVGAGQEVVALPEQQEDNGTVPSPSTARLENAPLRVSVFSLLKGSHHSRRRPPYNSGSSNSNNNHIHNHIIRSSDAPPTGIHLPMLTRTKARSSFKQKGKKRLFFQTRPAPFTVNLREYQSTIVAIQDATSSTLVCSSTADISQPECPLEQQQGIHDIFSPNRPSRSICSTVPTLSRFDQPSLGANTRSSSIMGLYGSTRSSPNGSMVDAASTRAMYCMSLKSAMSLATHTDLPVVPDANEIVIASALHNDPNQTSQSLPE
ncbi:hypothetical protein BG011_005551 [Mortierella polycephala]|uniref:Uncharacterized protein n=1 Tax=Mortierella polycephala TaxID=41804 RepID=A0A9P6U149_9FUNG|nr:hypothetical protein BG011_005551 [Mortierella polycephala]